MIPRPAGSASRTWGLAFATLLILAATLPPAPSLAGLRPEDVPPRPLHLADALRNVVLFLPFGASLGALGLRAARASLAGAALSAAIELAQLAIPGRDASAADVVSNTLGSALGLALLRMAPTLLRPSRRAGGGLALGAAALAGLAAWLPAPLSVPVPTESRYFGLWTPDLAHLARYDGTVSSASLDDLSLPHGRLADDEGVRTRLRRDYDLAVSGTAGTRPERLAGLFLVTDQERREIVVLGPDGDDLVYRFRSRGETLGLEPAKLRVPDILVSFEKGVPFDLRVSRHGPDFCVLLNGEGLDGERRCGLGFRAGDGWRFIAPDFAALTRRPEAMGAAWVAGLFLPIGYWGYGTAAGAGALAAGAGALLLIPSQAGLLPTPWAQLAAAAAGALVGGIARRGAERWQKRG